MFTTRFAIVVNPTHIAAVTSLVAAIVANWVDAGTGLVTIIIANRVGAGTDLIAAIIANSVAIVSYTCWLIF